MLDLFLVDCCCFCCACKYNIPISEHTLKSKYQENCSKSISRHILINMFSNLFNWMPKRKDAISITSSSQEESKQYLQEMMLECLTPEQRLREIIHLPEGLDYNEWLASHSKYRPPNLQLSDSSIHLYSNESGVGVGNWSTYHSQISRSLSLAVLVLVSRPNLHETIHSCIFPFTALAFFDHINLLYGTISEFCTMSGCPDMVGPCYR